MKNLLLVGIIILLLSSCGQPETRPLSSAKLEISVTPTKDITTTSTSTIITAIPTKIENTSTLVLVKGLAPDKFRKYIGLNYPPLPNELSSGFSSLIWDTDYALSLVSDSENEMLWLEKLTHHDSNGKAYWEVKDILELPNLEGDVVFISNGCLLNKTLDYKILVIGKWDDKVFVSRYMTNEKILLAWKANPALGIFEVMPTDGIECHADNAIGLNK